MHFWSPLFIFTQTFWSYISFPVLPFDEENDLIELILRVLGIQSIVGLCYEYLKTPQKERKTVLSDASYQYGGWEGAGLPRGFFTYETSRSIKRWLKVKKISD